MLLRDLLNTLYKQGLGEFLVLHASTQKICLGTLSYDKGNLVIKDKGYLEGVKLTHLLPCWEDGVMGLICKSDEHQWESLTFCGREQCDLPVDLSSTRHGAFMMAKNEYGENLLEFVGSVYRGFQLMLDSHYLPVVLLNQIYNKSGEPGLAIGDLRTAQLDLSVVRKVNDAVRHSVDKHLYIDVEDTLMGPADFEKLFGNYVLNNSKDSSK